MKHAFIAGVGSYLPDTVLTNDDLAQTLDTSHEWIFQRTGIAQRHLAAEGQLTSDLAAKACCSALEDAGVLASEVDLLILATATPDHTFPATATAVQAKIGMTEGFAFDISAVCSGFLFALATADSYLRQGLAKTALVVGAETLSRIIDWQDRGTAILFGDGAGAIVLKARDGESSGIVCHVLHTDGRGYDALRVSGGASSSKMVGTIEMNGREVFKHAVHRLEQIVDEVLTLGGLQASDIDWLVPHQANTRIIDAVLARLQMPREKAILTIDLHANTSAASIPLALDWGIRSGKIKRGDVLLMEAFAAGFAWSASILRF